jgi:hypothetical protein
MYGNCSSHVVTSKCTIFLLVPYFILILSALHYIVIQTSGESKNEKISLICKNHQCCRHFRYNYINKMKLIKHLFLLIDVAFKFLKILADYAMLRLREKK